MTRDIEIELILLETSWKLHGLINENKSEKIIRDFFISGALKVQKLENYFGVIKMARLLIIMIILNQSEQRNYFANFMNGLVYLVTENYKDMFNNGIGMETKSLREIMWMEKGMVTL